MASPPPPYPLILSLLLLISTAAVTAITIPISPSSAPASTDLHQILAHLASASVSRALRLKSTHNLPQDSSPVFATSLVKTPLFPRSYGGYSISLSFGTPPQSTSFVMDTGSSLVWFPCTSRYLCSRCNFPNVDPAAIPSFIPRNSSTAMLLGCKNPKCQWIYGPNVESKCSGCDAPGSSPNCTQTCPPYMIQYGLGSTAGLLLTETLDFPEKKVPDFLVGCSILSARQPEGIAGFGRGLDSLPSQVGAKKFSYCLVSHSFDDAPVSSDLVLDLDSGSGKKTAEVSYTPFRKNPVTSNSALQTYYYVNLRQIVVEGKHVKVPSEYLEPGSDGNGGTIVDSGTTFTYMERPVFEAVVKEIGKRMANFTVATEIQDLTGLRPCYNVSGQDTVSVPELSFKFKGGAEMKLPVTNYFVLAGDGAICFTIVSDNVVGTGLRGGPAIILGNYQQRDYYIEYDLEKERFGFKRQVCA
ncbi:unnamed protein product [Linum tenue]|uniref:Peptidase A1 domain-containing protein n=1 Tax=Linum tenue TaxID=586396 RepID=A0AAV0I2L1_9ROSI|nr:unnamed protein product [Linum tenue]